MTTRGKNENDMPDVPGPDFVGALCEIWATINYDAYHLAYIQVYLQTAALQTQIEEMHRQDQAFRDVSQIDLHVCRAHLAALFWQVDHVFEALRIAINKGQKEHAEKEYFWSWGKSLEKIEASPIILVIRYDVVVVGELFVADRAYSGLLPHLAVQQFSHLCR